MLAQPSVSFTQDVPSSTSDPEKRHFFTEFGPFGQPAVLPAPTGRSVNTPMRPTVPVIDLSALDTDETLGKAQLAQQLLVACQDVGFFYAVNHGVDRATIDDAMTQMQAFFARPEDEKMQLHWHKSSSAKGYERVFDHRHEAWGRGDMKEAFAYSAAIEQPGWPDSLIDVRDALNTYNDGLRNLATKLHRVFAIALELPVDYFESSYRPSSSGIRAIRYPSQKVTKQEEVGIGAHTDVSWLTILHQDDVGGLEAQMGDGSWFPVIPKQGAFVVNIGDYLQYVSGNRLKSTRHHVVNRANAERHSLAFFWSPNGEDILDIAPTCRDADCEREKLVVKDYSRQRFIGSRLSHPKFAEMVSKGN